MEHYFSELHNHLYGSLSVETLFQMGRKNPSPRWFIFSDLYKQLYGEEMSLENFWKKYNTPEKLKSIYYFNKKAPFLEFQCKFNLVISMCKFDETEIKEITQLVMSEHYQQGIRYIEYKITYSPIATELDYRTKSIALCEGLYLGEKNNKGMEARLIITFHRGGNFQEQYEWIQKLMKENQLVAKYLVAIDFSNVEEGFPPKDKKDFFSHVLMNNSISPDKALAITYHVGESFQDKTPQSAIRWIIESAMYGAHRLGHAIALGENVSKYEGKWRKEPISERIDHIHFVLQNYEFLESFGNWESPKVLKKELENLKENKLEYYHILMDEKYIQQTISLQKLGFLTLKKQNTIIESCPTSNYLIGMIDSFENLPLKKFIKEDLKVTIGADDPGIFDTTLAKEYQIASQIGVTQENLEKIRVNSFDYKSEKLSGRKTN